MPTKLINTVILVAMMTTSPVFLDPYRMTNLMGSDLDQIAELIISPNHFVIADAKLVTCDAESMKRDARCFLAA